MLTFDLDSYFSISVQLDYPHVRDHAANTLRVSPLSLR